MQNIDFTHVEVTKLDNDRYPTIYACGSDKIIREIVPKENKDQNSSKMQLSAVMRYEESVQLSKLQFTHDRQYFFAGKIEKDQPGSIQVLQFANKDEPSKMFEIQAHGKAVERLRLSYDNSTLFSCGLDGSVACFNVINREKKKTDSAPSQIILSSENLLLKAELDKKKLKIDSLR
jgi:WD40 repeat protein